MANWDQCNEFARSLDDDGRERVVYCSLEKHSAPGDETVWHWDDDLEIRWRFFDDED